jgi:hypothetical protein
VRIAEWLAFAALVAAFVAAIGPANEVRSTYTWPPEALPNRASKEGWYTPLLLATRVPESLTVTTPCGPSQPLASSQATPTVVATARVPRSAGALAVAVEGRWLDVWMGARRLVRAQLASTDVPLSECAFRLTMSDETWTLAGGPAQRTVSGKQPRMPTVNGLFSSVDLRKQPRPSIAVTTRFHDTAATTRQTILWLAAVLGALISLVLIAGGGQARVLFDTHAHTSGRWICRIRVGRMVGSRPSPI